MEISILNWIDGKALFTSVKMSLNEISDDLKDIESRRDSLIKNTRDVLNDCSNSIISLHRSEINKATQRMERAKATLDALREQARTDLYKYISVPEQELVEAYMLRAITEDSLLPSSKELSVSGSSYLTGLLDCVGELKRMVYDRLRAGKPDESTKLFLIMEEIYSSVYPFAAYDNLVPGLRRKLDVAKVLIEDIRAIVTEEKRRQMIMSAMDNLKDHLEKL
ncbi:MAG: RNA-binding protein [Nitrososphaeraceae archaeon]|jgi:translin